MGATPFAPQAPLPAQPAATLSKSRSSSARRFKMKPDATTALILSVLLTSSVSNTATANPSLADTVSGVDDATTPRSIQVDSKVERKISMAVGEEIGDFVVTAQEQVESGAGSNATQYTVATNGGRKYKCQIIEPSRAGKFFSFGTAAGADALCTEFGDSNGNTPGTANATDGKPGAKPEPAAAIAVSDSAARKISMAIGEETDRFVVTKQEEVDSSAGMKGTEYTVKTDDGKTYKCQLFEPSRLGKIVSFGTAAGADALCTDFTQGSPSQGKTNQANCNALLRAAHKCD